MIAICGMGKSLKQADVEYLQGKCRVIVINEVYQIAPWADWLYAADSSWYDHYLPDIRDTFQGQLWTQARDDATTRSGQREKEFALANGIRYASLLPHEGFSTTPGSVHSGFSSGYQAMQLAVQWGATQILLLGFDGYKGCWLSGRPKKFRRESPYNVWLKAYRHAAKHCPVPIINCSQGSAYDCFPYRPLRECLLPDS